MAKFDIYRYSFADTRLSKGHETTMVQHKVGTFVKENYDFQGLPEYRGVAGWETGATWDYKDCDELVKVSEIVRRLKAVGRDFPKKEELA